MNTLGEAIHAAKLIRQARNYAIAQGHDENKIVTLEDAEKYLGKFGEQVEEARRKGYNCD
jgi:hypothetical protein